ncbi:MAG: UPF0236 family protein [Nitrospinaceae bacterium]|nr:UPF0236 family protein [Nitrospinaceae bacterium]
MFGSIEVKESLWRNPSASYIRLLPSAIGVSSRSCSVPLQRAVCDFGMEASFEQAGKRVKEHYGFTLPVSAVASVTREHARAIAAKQEAREGAHILPGKGAATVVAEADGSFLRIVSTDDTKTDRRKTREVQYREARLCAACAKGSQSIYYDATFSDVRNIAGLWSFTAKDAGMAMHSKVHIVADGADWIHAEGSSAFGHRGSFLIDLYHVLEYLHEAAPACSRNPQRWLNTQKKRLKNGHSKKVIAELKKHIEPDASPDTESPVRCAWRYLNNRRDCLAYDEAITQDLPLGSGLIESGNKHVLQARLKIPGASWNLETAENFAKTRAVRANGQWNSYWDSIRKQAA